MKFPGLVKVGALWDALRTSYWFVPTVMAAAAVLLWAAVHAVDMRLGEKLVHSLGWIYTGGPEGARELLAVVAGSMITVAGVTFSITIVALTLASQQFGPFLLRNFMRDTGNQIVLGTFISTFIFCLLSLRVIRSTDRVTFVPHLSVSVALLLTLSSLGVLIYFIHHVSAFIQASNIIAVVSDDLEGAILRLFPERLGLDTAQHPELESYREKLPPAFEGESAPVRSPAYGYMKALDNEMLMQAAMKNGLIVRMRKRPGDFIGEGDVIASVWPGESVNREVEKSIHESLVLGAQRTATQDVEFVFNQIVEVAVRSLSPGINDPFTAIICIDHLGQGLRQMAGRAIPSPCRYGEDGALRVIACPVTFPEMADIVFNQIRHYGRSSTTVLNRLLGTIAAVARHVSRQEDRRALRHHASLILEAGSLGLEEKEAREELKKHYYKTLGALDSNGTPGRHARTAHRS